MLKHGVASFKFEIICICFDDDMDRFEEEYIEKYNSVANGYNIRQGGNTAKWTEEMKKKIRGLKKSAETCKRMSDSGKLRIGPKNNFFGKTHTEETKQVLRDKALLRPGTWTGKHLSAHHKQILSEKVRHKFKKVDQLSLDGKEVLMRFESLSAAARHVGVDDTSIKRVCANKQHTSKGFKWRWGT
jgi:group I intron endonuclease